MQPAGGFRKLRHLEESLLRQREAAFALISNLFYQVRRVAGVAGEARRRMRRVVEPVLVPARDVAGKAPGRVFRRAGLEREDQLGARKFLAGSPAASCSASAWALPGPWQVSHPVTIGHLSRGCGLGLCRQRPGQCHQVIHQLVDFGVGHVQRGKGGITVPARRPSIRCMTSARVRRVPTFSSAGPPSPPCPPIL